MDQVWLQLECSNVLWGKGSPKCVSSGNQHLRQAVGCMDSWGELSPPSPAKYLNAAIAVMDQITLADHVLLNADGCVLM